MSQTRKKRKERDGSSQEAEVVLGLNLPEVLEAIEGEALATKREQDLAAALAAEKAASAAEQAALIAATQENESRPAVVEFELKRTVESLLFASDRPLTAPGIRQLVGQDITRADVQEALDALSDEYSKRGIVLHDVAGGYQFRTHAASSQWVQKLIAGRPVRLSRAQLDSLAIIAYRQPITRPEIDDIRGVDSGSTLKLLLDRSLVRVLGKKEEAGRPLLYGTTKDFLEFFNLSELRDLPTLREFHELNDEGMAEVDKLGADIEGVDVGAVAAEVAAERAAAEEEARVAAQAAAEEKAAAKEAAKATAAVEKAALAAAEEAAVLKEETAAAEEASSPSITADEDTEANQSEEHNPDVSDPLATAESVSQEVSGQMEEELDAANASGVVEVDGGVDEEMSDVGDPAIEGVFPEVLVSSDDIVGPDASVDADVSSEEIPDIGEAVVEVEEAFPEVVLSADENADASFEEETPDVGGQSEIAADTSSDAISSDSAEDSDVDEPVSFQTEASSDPEDVERSNERPGDDSEASSETDEQEQNESDFTSEQSDELIENENSASIQAITADDPSEANLDGGVWSESNVDRQEQFAGSANEENTMGTIPGDEDDLDLSIGDATQIDVANAAPEADSFMEVTIPSEDFHAEEHDSGDRTVVDVSVVPQPEGASVEETEISVASLIESTADHDEFDPLATIETGDRTDYSEPATEEDETSSRPEE